LFLKNIIVVLYKMAYVSDFTFNGLSRLGNDSCSLDQNSIQNSSASSYILQNYFAQDCNMSVAKKLATTQPGINYSGGFGLGAGGCNVDESSKLLIGSIQTNPKARIDLFGRPFATVPFLGRGSVDPILEAQIQQGESITNKRSVTKLTEKSYLKYHTTPLIPEVKQNIQNPSQMIEGLASEGWVRGGVPSRELTRDRDFYTAGQ
jgi:hypothetical protein